MKIAFLFYSPDMIKTLRMPTDIGKKISNLGYKIRSEKQIYCHVREDMSRVTLGQCMAYN